MDTTANPAIQLEARAVDITTGVLQQGHHINSKKADDSDVVATLVNERQSGQDTPADVFPGDVNALSAWIVLLGSFLTLFPSFGFMVSIGTFQDYWSQNQLAEYTSQSIGWISGVFVYLALALGLVVGPLFDRFGPRWIALVGSVAYIVSIFLLAECKTYWQFMLCLGLLGGMSAAALTTTGLAVVSHWFKKKRGLAAGLAMMGNAVGGLAIPLILQAVLPSVGYKWAIRILGFIFIGCLVVGNILMKPRLPPSKAAKEQGIFSLHLFGKPEFSFLTVTVFGIEVVLFGALGILPTYASSNPNYPPETGFYLIAVMNGVSCLGRIIPGFVSDIYGRFNVFGIMILVTLIIMLVIWLPFGHTNLVALYLFVAMFGFGTGSWMALVPACIGQLCEAEQFGRYFGTLYFVASLATLICIPVAGALVSWPQVMVGCMCAVLAVSLGTLVLSRWAYLGWKWSWKTKV